MVRDLHRLLGAAGIEGPYILVAHSLGGLLARSYARIYPREVAGVILVDATSDRDFAEALARLPSEMRRLGGFGTLGATPLIVIRRGKTAQPPSAADISHRAQSGSARHSVHKQRAHCGRK